MKKMMMIMAMMVTIATHAAAMSYNEARNEALFLTDKMAYELNLTNEQYEAVYEINLDYLMGLSRHDIFGSDWTFRNSRLRHVLTSWQYDRYMAANYFYRPVTWTNNSWRFNIYSRYTNRNHFYRPRPDAVAHHNTHTPARPHNDTHVTMNHGTTNHGTVNHGTPTRPTNHGTTTSPTRPNTTHTTHTSTSHNSWRR